MARALMTAVENAAAVLGLSPQKVDDSLIPHPIASIVASLNVEMRRYRGGIFPGDPR
jgi:hypothetical protein